MRASFLVLLLLLLLVGCGRDLAPEPIHVVYNPDLEYPEMDRHVGGSLDALRVPGIAALAIQDGAIVYEGYFGFADMQTGDPVTSDSIFYLASVSKVVVAAAAMSVEEADGISLDDPVAGAVEFPVAHPDAPETPITFRHIFTHTSGIEDNWDVMEPLIVDGDSPIAHGDFLEGYLTPDGDWYSADQNFGEAPGGRSEYSNAAISLLAFAAGQADGDGFEGLCQRTIFDPLGMASASWHLSGVDQSALTSPHIVEDGEYVRLEHYGYPDYPDGGLRVTARDLAAFVIAHTGADTLLGQESLDEMFRVQFPDLDSEQGLIWARYTDLGPTVVGHDGGDDGISTVLALDFETGDGAILLMNGDWYADDLAYELAGDLLAFEP